MLKFLDGPAQGVMLSCARAPMFLRVVQATDSRESEQEWDALDQLTDRPRPGERIHVYIKAADHGTVHYDGRDKHGKRFGRWEQMADYRICDPQPDETTLRDQARWEAWAREQYKAAKATKEEA